MKPEGRTFTQAQMKKRRDLYFEISRLTDDLNSLIDKAINLDMTPDLSITFLAHTPKPLIRVEFLRDTDAIQS